MLRPSLRQHFSLKQFRPSHERPVTFIVSQWQHDKTTPNIKYFLYRISIFIIFFICWVFTIIAKDSSAGQSRWPIYLTNWGYTLCMAQALLASIMLFISVIAEKVVSKSHWRDKVLNMYSLYWVINVIATPVAFTISIIYWTLIYGYIKTELELRPCFHGPLLEVDIDDKKWFVCSQLQMWSIFAPIFQSRAVVDMNFDEESLLLLLFQGRPEDTRMSALNFMVHGMNTILMFIDLWIVSHPVQILHFMYPLLLALSYTIFTIIFYFAGGTTRTGSRYIYPILKWDKPGITTGICAGVMVLMIFLHLFTFVLYKIRIKLYEVLYLPRIDPPEPEKKQGSYVNQAMANDFV